MPPPNQRDDALVSSIRKQYAVLFEQEQHQSYHGGGFSNFGYWDESIRTGLDAGNNLVDKLLELVPRLGKDVLDVACGQGGTTRRIMETHNSSRVTAINIAEDQLAGARIHAPGARYLLMSATELDFPDHTFDTVICVEAAFHFNTRQKFLEEAFRVLKPNGYLVLSDILMNRPGPTMPQANVVSRADYPNGFTAAGFEIMNLTDATDRTWHAFRKHRVRKALKEEGLRRALHYWKVYRKWNRAFTAYVLVSARKPPTS